MSSEALPLPILPPSFEPAEYNTNFVLYWNDVCNDLIRNTVTLGGPLADPPGAARALGLLHLAINDAYFGLRRDANGNTSTTYLNVNDNEPRRRLPAVNGATVSDSRQAVAAASIQILTQLFAAPNPAIATAVSNALGQFIQQRASAFQGVEIQSAGYVFGSAVANAILGLLNDPNVFAQGNFTPVGKGQQYRFDDDPTNPVRIVPVDVNNPKGPTKVIHFYDAPFFGKSAQRLAIQDDTHALGDPPVGFSVCDQAEYDNAFKEVYALGGATALNSTKRTPKQQQEGFFWAYDGTNLIGTPPRHNSQILRAIAWSRKPAGATDEATNADFVRLFAIVMAAQGDAAIIAWLEKYNFSFWRPLSGVRQDNANPLNDPFWLTLGAPETNSNQIPFKPPFPSYPSGHATFAGAFFQAIRLYYKRRDNLTFADDAPDNISFSVRSDELDGFSRDFLRAPFDITMPIENQIGTVRTDFGLVTFKSCWDAMYRTGLSRVFLGVHWGFDAFAGSDVRASIDPSGVPTYKDSNDVRYTVTGPRHDRDGQFVIGGVPLGIGIANDIFRSGLKPTPAALQPPFKTTTTNGVPKSAVTFPQADIDTVQKALADGIAANTSIGQKVADGVVANHHAEPEKVAA